MHIFIGFLELLLIHFSNLSLAVPYTSFSYTKHDRSDRSAIASGRVSGVSLLESRGPAKAQPSPGYPIVRHVLGTRTIIYAHVRQIPIDPAVIGATIRQAQDTVEGIMKTERDRWLPPAWDPYIADWHWGAYIFVESSEKPGRGGRPQHLTFGILNSTFEGLFQIAYVLGYSQELDFEVLDSDWGIVGAGYIMAGSFHDGSVRGQKERSAGWIPMSSKDGSDATTAF